MDTPVTPAMGMFTPILIFVFFSVFEIKARNGETNRQADKQTSLTPTHDKSATSCTIISEQYSKLHIHRLVHKIEIITKFLL